MIKLQAKNYQVLDDVEFEFDGVSCAIGENDEGKSAVHRCFRQVVTNKPAGDGNIQNGTDESEVTLEHGDLSVTWSKKRGSGAEYELNGEHHSKIGKGSFDELLKHGLSPIETNGGTFYLQFWDQKAPFLICNRPDTRKFELLSSLFDQESYNDVLNHIKSDVQELGSELNESETKAKQLEEMNSDIEQKLDCMEPLDDINLTELEELQERYEKAKQLNRQYNELNKTVQELNSSIESIEQYNLSIDVDKQLDHLETASELHSDYRKTKNELDVLSGAESTVNQYDLTTSVSDTIERYDTVSSLKEKYNECTRFLDKTDFDFDLEFGIDKKVVKRFDKVRKVDYNYTSTKQELDELEDEVFNAKEQVKVKEKEIKQLEEELGVCPTCEREF
jgi:DNA repair ATPase RecN